MDYDIAYSIWGHNIKKVEYMLTFTHITLCLSSFNLKGLHKVAIVDMCIDN